MKFSTSKELNFKTQDFINVYKQRCPNGDVFTCTLDIEETILNSQFIKEFSFTTLFENESFIDSLHFRCYIQNDDIKNSTSVFYSDGFDLASSLSKKLFLGGSYLSTMKAVNKYIGPEINEVDSFAITLDFMFNSICDNLADIFSFGLFSCSWGSWFDGGQSYLSDSYFIFNKVTHSMTFLLFKDSD